MNYKSIILSLFMAILSSCSLRNGQNITHEQQNSMESVEREMAMLGYKICWYVDDKDGNGKLDIIINCMSPVGISSNDTLAVIGYFIAHYNYNYTYDKVIVKINFNSYISSFDRLIDCFIKYDMPTAKLKCQPETIWEVGEFWGHP